MVIANYLINFICLSISSLIFETILSSVKSLILFFLIIAERFFYCEKVFLQNKFEYHLQKHLNVQILSSLSVIILLCNSFSFLVKPCLNCEFISSVLSNP